MPALSAGYRTFSREIFSVKLSLQTNLLEAVLTNTQTERKLPTRPRMMTPRVTGVMTASRASMMSPSVTGHP